LIAESALVTVPLPAPFLATESKNWAAGAKVAPTVTADVPRAKTHDPDPLHGPVQPENTEAFEDGAAVKVTVEPLAIALVFVHVPDVVPDADTEQLIPPVPVIVPAPVLPVPEIVTVTALKFAVTDCADVIDTEHVPVPLHAPPQPANADPVGALGVNTTSVP
jgi:hypothetical protein